jgi:divalent metal cation (Fe/Co/Zn/Cd) transporter
VCKESAWPPFARASGSRVFTVVGMAVETAVSIGAGFLAHSALLTTFGIDSVIELVSGAILLWRLLVEARGGSVERVGRAEQRAAWAMFISLVLLCVYVLVTSLYGLITQALPESSPTGIAITATAVVVMPWLAVVKRRLATRLESGALRGDADSSLTCAFMAATVLVGLLANALLYWWWAEDVAALIFLFWLVQETREVLQEAREGNER